MSSVEIEVGHPLAAVPPAVTSVLALAVTWRRDARGWVAETALPAWAEAVRLALAQPAAMQSAAQTQTAGDEPVRIIVAEAAARSDDDPQRWSGFRHLLVDPGNQLAVAACRRVAASPGLEHNPLFLHGPSGSGKTRLLQAVCAEIAEGLGGDGIVWMTGEELVARWAHELVARQAGGIRARLASAAVVVVDGIDPLALRDLAQEELFHLINDSRSAGRQLLFSGRSPPIRIEGLTERLATRLSWGLVEAVELPQAETLLACLRRLSPAAMARDPSELAALIDRYAQNFHQVLRLAERLDAGDDPGREPRSIPVERILAAVADHTGLRPQDIAGKSRHRAVSRARQLALLLARRLTGHSSAALGTLVGGRDHSTVLYAIRMAEERAAADPAFAREVEELARSFS